MHKRCLRPRRPRHVVYTRQIIERHAGSLQVSTQCAVLHIIYSSLLPLAQRQRGEGGIVFRMGVCVCVCVCVFACLSTR